uniref:Uncharacterized protein n=1 Tax=Aegilops tauschii subsp. strangulata TaxID=200361 RepID=A0A453PD67_AEGTS
PLRFVHHGGLKEVISSWWTADATLSALRLINSTADIYVNMMIENHQSVGDIYIYLLSMLSQAWVHFPSVYAMSGPSI